MKHCLRKYVVSKDILLKKKNGRIDNAGVKIIRILGKKRVKKVGFSTVDEIIDDILKTLPSDFQERIKQMTADEFRISQYSDLGMTIRNKYFYRNKSREQLIESLGNKKEYIFLDGDVFSRIVLKKLYEKITTESKQQP